MGIRAWCRATREMAGLSLADVAHDLGVSEQSVKRWEREDRRAYEVHDDVIEYYEREQEKVIGAAAAAYDSLYGMVEETGGEAPKKVQLTYYRTQAMHDRSGREPARFGQTNAVNRAFAAMLIADGVKVEWAYPDDEDKLPTP